MKSSVGLWIGILVAVGLVAGGVYWRSSRPPRPGTLALAPVATPPGITLQPRAAKRSRRPTVADLLYSDADGMTLYLAAPGRAGGTPACGGECERTWLPALAPPGAAAGGDWSLVARPDGARQWALRRSPLYRFRGDAAVGDANGDGAEGGAWQAASFRAEAGLTLPAGIAVREIAAAGGWGLVDADAMTLYAYRGAGRPPPPPCGGEPDCAGRWLPSAAPAIAAAAGDFAVIERDDGISQWAYRGDALYTYDRDLKAGDANGVDAGPQVRAALILRQFMPADAVIRRTTELGSVLATRSGATLYQRDRVNPDESHDLRGDRGTPALGRAYGTATCEADCVKLRPPFAAPMDALPSGYWGIVARADGSRQWTYRGFALYTFAGEQPGELRGNESYELALVGDDAAAELAATGRRTPRPPGTAAVVDPLLPFGAAPVGLGVSALYWHAVVP